MPITGHTRHRKIQIGKQSALLTAVPATRVLPYSGVPAVNLGYEADTADIGSIDPIIADYRTSIDATLPMTGKTNFNDLPYWYAGAFKGGVTPTTSGTAKTWAFQLASLTADDFDYFTLQQGNDNTNNWYQLVGSIVESMNISSPDNLGPFDITGTWRAADAKHKSSADSPVSGTVPTAALSVDSNPVRMFAADTQLFIDDAFGGIGGTQISDAVYAVRFSFTPEIDQKRFMNGSNTRFALAGYGRGPRVIELAVDFAETTQIIGTGSEMDKWFHNTPVNRFVELKTISSSLASAGIPYSNSLRMPLRYTTSEGGTRDNNTIITLTGRAYYDSDLGYALRASVVNTLASL